MSLKRSHLALYEKALRHDTAFVYEVRSKVCQYVKGDYQHITKVKYFSDGYACSPIQKLQKFLKSLPPLY